MTQGEGQGRLASEHRFEEKKEKTVLIIYRGHLSQITSDFCPPASRQVLVLDKDLQDSTKYFLFKDYLIM